jgi:hypothetical protein
MSNDINLAALMSSLTGWEKIGYVGLSIVIVGVVGEGIHDFTEFGFKWWRKHGGRVSVLVLIVGLAIEGVAQVNANNTSGRIIALLATQAANSQEKAAGLEREAAQLQLDLARLKAPRSLSKDAQSRVADKIRPIGSKPFTVGEGAMEPGSQLDTQLIDTLIDGGWTVVLPKNVMTSRESRAAATFSDEFGVVVSFSENRREEFSSAVEELVKALNDEGIVTKSHEMPEKLPLGAINQDDTINILIAPKPP